MKAIILAAGRGSRMKAMTDERPKCLVELRGKPLIEWQLEALRDAGISDIAIVTGYKRELLLNRGLVEFHNVRWAETNMVSSLACAQEWLQAEPCIVSYADIFYSSVAVQSLMTCDETLAITYDPNWLELWRKRFDDPLLDAETFRLTACDTLAEIGKKPSSVDEIQGQYMGLLLFTPLGWGEFTRVLSNFAPHDSDKISMTETLQAVIDCNRIKIKAIRYNGSWGEVDSPNDVSIFSK